MDDLSAVRNMPTIRFITEPAEYDILLINDTHQETN